MKPRILALCLVLAACATPAPAPVAPVSATSSQGILVSIRSAAADAALRQTILTAVGANAAPAPGPSAELVIRLDGGGTISVIQPDNGALRPGARVLVMSGAQVTVLPAR
jgi:hypothetical protein